MGQELLQHLCRVQIRCTSNSPRGENCALRVNTEDFNKSNHVVLMLFSTLLKSLHDNIIH